MLRQVRIFAQSPLHSVLKARHPRTGLPEFLEGAGFAGAQQFADPDWPPATLPLRNSRAGAAIGLSVQRLFPLAISLDSCEKFPASVSPGVLLAQDYGEG